uniref:DOMON domain-containing protein n=1 Tax=Amphimedon queenslandica TaxID=400682 RepID=A0A1X7VNC9_AMPQE
MNYQIVVLAFIFSLLSLSLAQCTGALTNSSHQVSVSWMVVGENSVSFTFTAPANSSTYTSLVISDHPIILPLQFNNVDVVYAGDNETTNFVEDRWIVNFMSLYDKQQDIEDTSTLLTDDDLLMVNFTRPIISTDEAQDTNLNACKYLIWAYGGTVESFKYPKFTFQNLPQAFGTFNGQICLQYYGVTPSPSASLMSSSTPTSSPSSQTPSAATNNHPFCYHVLLIFESIDSLKGTQCSGNFTSSTQQVTLDWTVIDSNTVNFIYTAPSTSSQYTALAFSNQLITSALSLANVDAVYAGDNGAVSFVQDRWIESALSNQLDAEQNLQNTSASLSDDFLTVNFTRPIISPDKNQDLDLNTCKYVIYLFNGTGAVSSIPSLDSLGFGMFPMQLCLQYCEDVPSPSTTTPSSTGAVTISTTSVQSSPSFSSGSSGVSATPTATPTSTPSGASAGMIASILLIMIAVAIVLYTGGWDCRLWHILWAEDGFTTKMQGLLKLFLLAGLFTISLAQCSGNFTNSAQQVTIDWTVIDSNTVIFIYTAPSTSSQYTALAFSNQLITSALSLANVDAVYAGNNGTVSFVQDRWIPSALSNQLDAEQNLQDTSASLSSGFLTVNFTRPIISPDKTQDLDLNTCKYVIYVFNGTGAVDSIPSLDSLGFGIFSMQLCLQYCEDVPSPSTTIPSSTGTMSTTTISTTSVQSFSSISSYISVSATPTTTSTSTPSGASAGMIASILLIMIAVAIVLHTGGWDCRLWHILWAEDGFTTKMEGLLKLFLLAGLFTISLAQCSGSYSNTTQQVTLEWTVIDDNTVNFIYTAPSTSTQYTALAFSNQLISQASLSGTVALDAVYAGSNGTSSFVQDRWVTSIFNNMLDTEQNLEDTSASLSNGLLTVNFTRPIISPDNYNQDLDLNVCQYVIYVFNGAVMGSFSSPSGFNIPTGFGILPMQLCLQNCSDVPSPSTTVPSSTGAVTVSTTFVQSSPSISGSSSVSATLTPTATPTSTPSGASAGMIASVLLIMIAVAIVLHV